MIRDMIYFSAIFFVVVVSIPIAYLLMSEFNDAIQDADMMPSIAKDSMQNQTDKFNTVWDYTILITFLAVAAGLIGIAYILPTNPIVVFATMVVMVVLAMFTGYLANAWETMTEGVDPYAASATSFTIANFIMSYYLHFTVAIAFIVLIVFYAKPQQEGVF